MSTIYDSVGTTPAASGKTIYDSIPGPKAAPAAAPVTPGPINRAIGSVVGGVKALGSDVFGALTAPEPDTSGPVSMSKSTSAGDDVALATINSYSKSLQDSMSKFSDAYKTIASNKSTPLDQQLAAGEASVGVLNTLFAPITAFITGTSHIPVLGGISQAVNNVFSAIGSGGSDAAEGAVQAIPGVSDETKAKMTPLARDLGALVGQIIAGKGSADTVESMTNKTHEFMGHVQSAVDGAKAVVETGPVRTVPVSGDSVETPVTPENKYTPDAALPTIDMGPEAKDTSGLPTIQTEAPEVSGPKTEPITTAPAADIAPENVPASSVGAPKAPALEPIAQEKTVTPGEQAPTKVATDISNELVKQGMDALTPEQMSTYTSGSYKDSAAQAEILKETNPEALKQMAITGKDIPAGVHPQILFNVVDELAAKTHDYELQRQLAKSPLGTERSEHAAGLGSSGFNKVSDSPVDVIRRASEVKRGGAKAVAKDAAEVKKAKSTITKAAAKLIDYDKILESLTC